MRPLLLLPLLVLTDCNTPLVDNPSLAQEQKATCGDLLYVVRRGEPEATMVRCAFPGWTPYVLTTQVDALGEHKVYRGSPNPKYIFVTNGKVTGWRVD